MDTWTKSLEDGVELLRKGKRSQKTVNAWFYAQEIKMREREAMTRSGMNPDNACGQAELLCRVAEGIPLSIPAGSALAGSQDAAFSPSYALINPSFKVEEFAGYCDPCAIYSDVTLEGDLTAGRVEAVREYWKKSAYVEKLYSHYSRFTQYTGEVAFFMEPVTGHTIPDTRPFLRHGVAEMRRKASDSGTEYGKAMARSLDAVLILARRYRELALEMAATTSEAAEKERLSRMAEVLMNAPAAGAKSLHEAAQTFVLLWQAMVLEQAPNPYAFSVGNIDRILAPYRGDTEFEVAVSLVRHILCFFQVGDRCWAISQNIMVGGRGVSGEDLTDCMTEAALEAFFRSNDPQPALSVKVHAETPESLYKSIGRFFFAPGHSTPSLFNDDSMFKMLYKQGVAETDLPDYSIAGCQEPLIMGKASLNTTNTWLNLGKVLELALNDGKSTITGARIGPSWSQMGFSGAADAYANAETAFFHTLDALLPQMEAAGNGCVELLGQEKPVPLTSSLMDSFTTFRDMRDPATPGTRYNASGCLIHGLSVVADSLATLPKALDLWTVDAVQAALASNFATEERMRTFMAAQPKYGNNDTDADSLAIRITTAVCDRISKLRNPAGNPYLADWSTPSTHLLYGYWVGATPDGRKARSMLGYGVDPRPAASFGELPERILSYHKLPYHLMTGGYASHIGIRVVESDFNLPLETKALWMRDRIIRPLFRLGEGVDEAPYYVYFNIDSAKHLRSVLSAPPEQTGGVYIMRIHGTFVNFLDLSPAIQEDIIERLEAGGKAA